MQKSLFLGATLALFLTPFCSVQTPVHAQTPVSLPSPAPEARLQLRDGTATLFERKPKNGVVAGTLSGDSGHYFAAWVSPDKNRTPLGDPISIVVPGVRREAGTWSFNGSILVENGDEWVDAPARFLPDLSRASKAKLPFSTVMNAPQKWATLLVSGTDLQLPPLPTKSPRSSYFVGYELRASNQSSRDDVRKLRVAIEAQSPGAALILGVDAASPLANSAQILDRLADLCDAVKIDVAPPNPVEAAGPGSSVLERSFEAQLWSVKVARRIAEEQPNYDLPIFVASSSPSAWLAGVSSDVSLSPMLRQFSPAQALELYASGATGLIVSRPEREALASIETLWRQNANWLTGAVTYEDAAILPSFERETDAFLPKLRAASRLPLLGRASTVEKAPTDSVLTIFDAATTENTLRGLRRSAEAGETIYIEGTPAQTLWKLWEDITKTQISALEKPANEVLTLEDVWIFGTQNAREFGVSQSVKIEIKPDLAAVANEKKGEARETKTRAIGKLSRDPNGFLLCPVGKGRVLWLPHRFERTPDAPFYAAIAGAIQTALVNVSLADVSLADRESLEGKNLRLAVRGTPQKTNLLAVFNGSSEPRKLQISMRGAAQLVENLCNGATVASKLRGFSTSFEAEIAPKDFGFWAFYETPKAREDQRKLKRLQARWR